MRPEHHGESATAFYCWRAVTIICAIPVYLVCQIGFPTSVVLLDHWWPGLPSYIFATVMFILVVLGFFVGFMLSKGIDATLLSLEIRILASHQSA
jgi:hypothetical protein